MEVEVQCPYCGEPLELWIDQSGGASQKYVEDCAVCCQPMQIFVSLDEDDECDVEVTRLDD